MLSSKQVGRKLSYKLEKTTQELYSGYTNYKLSNEDYKKVQETAKGIEKYPIYYVDMPGTVDEIRHTILEFSKESFVKGKRLIIMLDHTLLTKGKSGEAERSILANLQYMFMEIKKYDKNTIIQLSQMNRDIEAKERIVNNAMHFPMRRDIFGGDSIFQASDYLIVLHRPEMLGITEYGMSALPTKDLVYMHFLKVREGEPKILVFKNNLRYNRIDEHELNSVNK